MRLITWNVNARVGRETMSGQSKAVIDRKPDLVALQELRTKSREPWHKALEDEGLHVIDSFERLGARWNFNLLASRWPLTEIPTPEVPFPESLMGAVVHSDAGEIEVHVAHVPNGSTYGLKKVETFERIYERLARVSSGHRVLCGDFNSPETESPEGVVHTFGVPPPTPDRWDAAERSVLLGLAAHDLADVYRGLYGYEARDASWYSSRRNGFRLDHVFASRSLNAKDCSYHHNWREDGLSDHSAMEVIFEP